LADYAGACHRATPCADLVGSIRPYWLLAHLVVESPGQNAFDRARRYLFINSILFEETIEGRSDGAESLFFSFLHIIARSLTSDKFDNNFIALDSFDNGRQGLQCELDQLSIAYVTYSDPQDRWAVVTCCAANGKVAILRHQNRRTGNGFIPNLLIGSCQQTEIDDVNRWASGLTQCLSQRGRKLRIDQKEQNLFRRYNRVIRLPGSKGQNCVDISILKIRIFLKDRLSRLARRHQAKNVRDRNAQTANAWAAMHTISVDRYSFQKIC
jgi:hypothetical protein